jgi:hypothetical protein
LLDLKVPLDTSDSTKIGAVLTGLRGGLLKIVREGDHSTFDKILDTICNITNYQIREVQHYAYIDALAPDGARLRRQGGILSPPASGGSLSPDNRGIVNLPPVKR